jgi:hypothetical protein
MKIQVELKNISGFCADIFDMSGNLIMTQWPFATDPTQFEIEDSDKQKEVSLNKILKLKESGFDSDEIIKMNKEGML